MSEQEIIEYFRARAAENSCGYTSFLGAGVYNHLRSVVTDSLIQRGEFLTSYTPYQAEISQGTLQAIFEFQTLMCQLTGHGSRQRLDVGRLDRDHRSRADGRAADGAASRGRGAVAASGISPGAGDLHAQSRPANRRNRIYAHRARWMRIALEAAINAETAAVVVQSPNFFGVLEQMPSLASLAHAKGALLVVAITEGVSLGAVRPPAEADIVAMEGAELRPAAELWRPVRRSDRHAREIRAADAGTPRGRNGGQRTASAATCLTLATREQHIRREKATSNICTNQALCALAVNIHLCLLGKEGLKELAEQNLAKARFALEELEKIRGVRRAFSGPFFNEFVVEFPRSVKLVNAELLRDKIIGPLPLGSYFADLTKRGLFCVTETTSRAEIERMAAAIREILSKPI